MNLLFNGLMRHQYLGKKFEFSKIVNANYRFFRPLSSKDIVSNTENSGKEQNRIYQEIYRFPAIKYGCTINKCKWYQALAAIITIPTTVALYFGGIIDYDYALPICLSGCSITVNVFFFGSFFNKAIGFMYLSEDGTTIKISYLDNKSNRTDEEFPVEDIMPFSDIGRTPLDNVYRTVQIYSSKDLKPKLYLKMGAKITDEVKFAKVFGDPAHY